MNVIEFWKYHGCGNDFLLIEETPHLDYGKLAKRICERHLGLGADGLLVAYDQPLQMRIFNQDGSEASMCGNGIRCFLYHQKYVKHLAKAHVDVHTQAGTIAGTYEEGSNFCVEIDMGIPDFSIERCGLASEVPVIDYPFYMHCHIYMITTLFLGTIHTVLFVSTIADKKWERIGQELHDHPFFRSCTNVNFVEVINPQTIRVRTYEKGVGMTLACGSGASAAAYCAWCQKQCDPELTVLLESGSLRIKIKDEHVLMSGDAQYIGKGMYFYEEDIADGCEGTD